MLSSRRAACLPSLRTVEEITDLACSYFDETATAAELMKSRFGLDESALTPDILAAAGIRSAHEPIGKRQFSRFSRLCVLLSEPILKSARDERQSLLAYLEKSGFQSEAKPAFVDIGWAGTIQKSMGKLLNRPISGFYYATFESAAELLEDGHEVASFAEHMRRTPRLNKLASFKLLTEIIFCGSEKSLTHFDPAGEPVFKDNHLSQAVLQELDQLHEGALDFVKELKSRAGAYLSMARPDAAAAEYFYEEMLMVNFVRDESLGATLENGFSGASRMKLDAVRRKGWGAFK